MSEFARIFDARHLPSVPQTIAATTEECAGLAQRFGLITVRNLKATVTCASDGPTVRVTGRLSADIVQSCAVSGEDLPVRINEPVALSFVPASTAPVSDEIVELNAEELDEIEMNGTQFDLGEALAQGLALAIDPYLEGPGAEAARRKAGVMDPSDTGPFAALKKLLE